MNMKRWFACFLAAIMLLSALPLQTLAVQNVETRMLPDYTTGSLFEKLNYEDYPGLAAVKTAYEAGDLAKAREELLSYYRNKFAGLTIEPFSAANAQYQYIMSLKMYALYEPVIKYKVLSDAAYTWTEFDLGSNNSGTYIVSSATSSDSRYQFCSNDHEKPELHPYITYTDSNGATQTITADKVTSVRAGSNADKNWSSHATAFAWHQAGTAKAANGSIPAVSKGGTLAYSNNSMRAYLRFSSLPSSAKDVKLYLYGKVHSESQNVSGAEELKVCVLNSSLKDFNETTLTWNWLKNNGSLAHYCFDGVDVPGDHVGNSRYEFDWSTDCVEGVPSEWINLNTRFQDLTTYVQNGETYVAMVRLLDFIDHHDPESGTPAKRDIEPANRLAEFPYIYQKILETGKLSAYDHYEVMSWLYSEVDFLYRDGSNLLFKDYIAEQETYRATTNRGLWHLCGLYSAVQYFPEFLACSQPTEAAVAAGATQGWKELFYSRYDYVLGKVFLEDGAYGEATLAYPSHILQWLGKLLTMAKNSGDTRIDQADIRRKLIRLGRYMMDVSYPNTNIPKWGDGGTQNLMKNLGYLFEAVPQDTTLEDLGGSAYREDYEIFQNLRWYYARKNNNNSTVGIEPKITWSEYDGLNVVTDRTAWEYSKYGSSLFMNAIAGGNHAHKDALALTFGYDNWELLVDTGMTSYESDNKDFQWQSQNTDSHNTVEVDGLTQLAYATVEEATKGNRIDMNANHAVSRITAEVTNAYVAGKTTSKTGNVTDYNTKPEYTTGHKITSDITHRRNVVYVKELGEFMIVSDVLIPGDGGSHSYTQNWHTAVKAAPVLEGTTGYTNFNDTSAQLTIVQAGDENLSAATLKGLQSEGNSIFFQYSQTVTGTASYNTVLYPSKNKSLKPTVTAQHLTSTANGTVLTDEVASTIRVAVTDPNPAVGSRTVYYYNTFDETGVERTVNLSSEAEELQSYRTDATSAVVSFDDSGKLELISFTDGSYFEIPELGVSVRTGDPVDNITLHLVDGVLKVSSSDNELMYNGTTLEVTWEESGKINFMTLNDAKLADAVCENNTAEYFTSSLLIHFDKASALNEEEDWTVRDLTDFAIHTDESTMTGSFSGNGGNFQWKWFYSAENHMSYRFKAGDVVELRVMTSYEKDPSVVPSSPQTAEQWEEYRNGPQTAPYFDFVVWKDGSSVGSMRVRAEKRAQNTGAGYEIYVLQVPQTMVGKDIDQIELRYQCGENETHLDFFGRVGVDYIYLGDEEGRPSKSSDYLYFDFGNYLADQERYASEVYGGHNFDLESAWSCRDEGAYYSFAINNNTGLLQISALENMAAHTTETYVHNTAQSLLNYLKNENDVFQIRVRFDNCDLLDATMPKLKVLYASQANPANDEWKSFSGQLYPEHVDQDGEGYFVTYTLRTDYSYAENDEPIRRLRVDFYYLDLAQNTTDSSKDNANIAIDYIYLGSEAMLPLPMHAVEASSAWNNAIKNENPDAIEYPNDGAIRINKFATAENFNGTGVAQVELTAAGISSKSGTDVIFVLDISNSMAWSVENGGNAAEHYKLPTQTQTTKLYDAVTMIQEFSEELLKDNGSTIPTMDHSVSLVTFAGYDQELNDGSFYKSDAEKENPYLDSVRTAFSYQTDYAKIQQALDLTRVTGYAHKNIFDADVVRYDAQIGLISSDGTVSSVSGENRGGTNYDYAFRQASLAVTDMKEAFKTATGKDYETANRQTVVVFLTDGLPSIYNGEAALSSGGESFNETWTDESGITRTHNHRGTGDLKADGSGALTSSEGRYWDKQRYGMTANDRYTKKLAELTTGNDQATALATQVDRLEIIGFDMANGKHVGMETDSETVAGWINTILSGLVAGKTLEPINAANAADLKQFSSELFTDLNYAAQYTVVTDVIGAEYDLQTSAKAGGVKDIPAPEIVITRYDLWTTAETQDLSLLGTRKDSSTVLEVITFNEDGTEAYSSVIDERNGQRTNIMVVHNGSTYIRGEYVTYTKNSASEETFTWNISTIDGAEYSLHYDVYLTGSMTGQREEGNYPTNISAKIEYLDIDDQKTEKTYPVPEFAWGKATTSVEYYLVNEAGQPVNSAGIVIPFANRITVGRGETQTFNFNSSFIHEALSELPEGFVLYNPSAGFTVISASDGKGALTIQDTAAVVTTQRVDTDIENYAQTRVAYGVLGGITETPFRLLPDVAVLDYGKPMEMDVTKNETHLGYSYEVVGLIEYDSSLNLGIKRAQSGEASVKGSYGSFAVENGKVVYTPKALLEGTDEVFVAVKVTPEGNEAEYSYLYQKLTVLPATSVYYETNFADDVIHYVTDDWKKESPEDAVDGDTLQDEGLVEEAEHRIQTGNGTDYLYFGFDNSNADQERYSSAAYGNKNFDTEVSADTALYWDGKDNRSREPVIDNEAGTLSLTAQYSESSAANEFFLQSGPINGTTQYLNFDPSNAEIVQIRFKLEGFQAVSTGKVNTCIRAHINGIAKNDAGNDAIVTVSDYIPLDDSCVNSGEYMVVTYPLFSWLRDAETMNSIRVTFSQLTSINAANGEYGTLTVDYIYVGPADPIEKPVYGFDSSYLNDMKLSDGTSVYVEGRGVKPLWETNPDPAKYTEACFSFTGTGFDLISRTGKEQATIRVSIYTDPDMKEEHRLRTITVNNTGELELYQIPVVSVQGLDYGTYHIAVDVNAAAQFGVVNGVDLSFMDRGNQFYFDGIRIYDPIYAEAETPNETELFAAKVYGMDQEAYPHVKEVRNILLEADTFAALTGEIVGAVFVDSKKKPEITVTDPETQKPTTNSDPTLSINNHYALTVETYNKVGPKNEVYLNPNQAVAFKLLVDSNQLPAGIDVGAKTINGSEAQLSAGIVQAGNEADAIQTLASRTDAEIVSCTAQYYALNIAEDMFFEDEDGLRYCYLVIYNATKAEDVAEGVERNADHVISITDIKVAYAQDPDTPMPEDDNSDPGHTEIQKRSTELEEPVRFLVDGQTAAAAAAFIRSCLETPLVDENTKIFHSLNLASDISINYVISKDSLQEYETVSMECRIPQYEGSELTGYETVTLQPVEKDSYYYFTLTDLSAVSMNDVVEAVLYMSKDGRNYCSLTDSYSVAAYAYAQLGKAAASDSLKTLCADLLRYGAAAQTYKNYRSDSLADEAMTEAQKAYFSDLEAVSFGSTDRREDDCENEIAVWVGKTMKLDAKVTLRYVLNLSAYTGDLSQLRLKLSYRDINGELQTAEVTELSPYGNAAAYYAFDFDGLLAAELRNEVTAALYAGDTQISDSLIYTADTYGNGKTGDLLVLCKALFAYGDAAKDYFTAK